MESESIEYCRLQTCYSADIPGRGASLAINSGHEHIVMASKRKCIYCTPSLRCLPAFPSSRGVREQLAARGNYLYGVRGAPAHRRKPSCIAPAPRGCPAAGEDDERVPLWGYRDRRGGEHAAWGGEPRAVEVHQPLTEFPPVSLGDMATQRKTAVILPATGPLERGEGARYAVGCPVTGPCCPCTP